MGYINDIRQCSSIEQLFNLWKTKKPEQISYIKGNQQVYKLVDHDKDFFIADGIINDQVWNSGEKKKILFVLKEAYGTDWGDLTLATWIKNYHPCKGHPLWRRVARWVYGIQNTSENSIQRYIPNLTDTMHAECLDQIAVINLKKSGGTSSSDYGEIDAYAKLDREELKKEF